MVLWLTLVCVVQILAFDILLRRNPVPEQLNIRASLALEGHLIVEARLRDLMAESKPRRTAALYKALISLRPRTSPKSEPPRERRDSAGRKEGRKKEK